MSLIIYDIYKILPISKLALNNFKPPQHLPIFFREEKAQNRQILTAAKAAARK